MYKHNIPAQYCLSLISTNEEESANIFPYSCLAYSYCLLVVHKYVLLLCDSVKGVEMVATVLVHTHISGGIRTINNIDLCTLRITSLLENVHVYSHSFRINESSL